MLTTQLLTGVDELRKIAAEWSDLCQRARDELTVFATPDWYHVWWQHFRADAELRLIIVRDGELLVGIAPLMSRRAIFRGLPVRQLQFIENGNSLHNDFILDPAFREPVLVEILRHLVQELSGWDYLELNNLPKCRENYRFLLVQLQENDLPHIAKDGMNSPYIDIDRNWDSFYRNSKARTRKTLRQVKNKIDRAANWRLERVVTVDGYQQIRPQLIDVSRHSWSFQQGDSFATAQNLPFFDQLSEVAAEKGWLNIWGLYFDQKLVAFEYHLNDGEQTYGLRSCYHADYANLSPGAFLDLQILEQLFRSPPGLKRYDLGGSFDAYKGKWTDRALQHANLQVFNVGIYSRFLYALEAQLVSRLRGMRNTWVENIKGE